MPRYRRGHADSRPEALAGWIRAFHIIAGLDPVYGGPSYSVPRLCEALAVAGVETMLFSVAGEAAGEGVTDFRGYRDCRFAWDYARNPILRGLRSSKALSRALPDTARVADVIPNHRLLLIPNIRAARVAASRATPLVISPRGMLAPAALAFSPLKKRAFWALLQGPAIREAACIHATSEQEY